MYFSKITPDIRRQSVRRLLGNRQALHAAVESVQDDTVGRDTQGRLLWRLETSGASATLYILSPGVPNLASLGYRLAAGPDTQIRDYTPLLERLDGGQEYRFRLMANPIVAVHSGDGKARRVSLMVWSRQIQWLLDRAVAHGFEIPTAGAEPQVQTVDTGMLTFRRGGQPVRLAVCTYEGVLRVKDRDALVRTLTCGIGHGRGYGLGLITLAPVWSA